MDSGRRWKLIGVVSMYDYFFKRIVDVIISLIALVLLSPIFFVLFFLIKLDTTGPFIFSQVRIGRHRKEFIIYKLRTMDSAACVQSNDKTQTYVTTFENDPRITTIGLILRRFHIDELPQLINVLRGEMSLVGVRPDAPSQSTEYKNYVWVNRHLMRPGITGLSQVHANDLDFDFSLRNKYDLFYTKSKRKFKLDIYIIFRTVLKFFRGTSF